MNPETELERLARVYAELSDEGLEELARQRNTLTDTARQALEAEMSVRGIQVEVLAPSQPKEVKEHSGPLVMLKRYPYLPDALIAKSILDSARVDSYLADEEIMRLSSPFATNLYGGVKLMVRPEDAETAAALLSETAILPDLALESEAGEEQK
jgi:hypothetical protein